MNGNFYRITKNGYKLTVKMSEESGIRLKQPIKNQHSYMSKSGRITLSPGYFWDGATGAIDTPSIMRESAFHDFVCREYNKGKLTKSQRKMGDRMFKNLLIQGQMPRFRVNYVYEAVRKFFELKEWVLNLLNKTR